MTAKKAALTSVRVDLQRTKFILPGYVLPSVIPQGAGQPPRSAVWCRSFARGIVCGRSTIPAWVGCGGGGEVNFWRPGGGGFQALRPGEPFFFKTHAPHNRVVGGGFFGGAARLPASEAWDLLGPANGAVSLGQMLERIAYYRREPRASGEDPVIGCVFIRDVTFFPDDLTFDPPPDFSSNVVQGKTYDMGDDLYSRYFGDLMQMVLGVAVELDLAPQWAGFRRPEACAQPARTAGVQSRGRGHLPLAVRDHRRQDPPRPRGRPHPPGITRLWRGEPARQWASAPVGCAPHVRPRLSERGHSVPAAGSAADCPLSSATAKSSTQTKVRSSPFQTGEVTSRAPASSNGTWRQCSKRARRLVSWT